MDGSGVRRPARQELTPAYRAAAATVRPLVRAVTRHDWAGTEHLPTEGGFVVAVNHISHADPFAVAHFLYDNGIAPYFLGKASLFELPVLGRWLTACGQVPVHRGDGRAVEAFRSAVEAVQAGKCIVIMPESTITKDPLIWPMVGKTGAARIALTAGVPVLPLAQWGALDLLDSRRGRRGEPGSGRGDSPGTRSDSVGRKVGSRIRFRPWARPTMRMLLGPPVDLDDLRGRPLDAVLLSAATARIMRRITEGVAILRGEQAPPDVWDHRLGRRVRVDESGGR